MFRIRVKMGPQRNNINANNNNSSGSSTYVNKEWLCCLGVHVHTATIIIGLWHLFLNILALSLLAVIWRNPHMMAELETGTYDYSVDLSAPALPTPLSKVEPPYPYRDHSINYRKSYQNFDMGGLVCTCMIAITLMMIYGTIKGKPSHLLPFFCLQLFDFAITTLTAAGYLCYLQAIHRIIADSRRLPWREELLELSPEELVIVVLIVFVCIVLLKAYSISIVWRCYKYLTIRQQHMRALLPCMMPNIEGGTTTFPGDERAYSTLLPNYDEAVAQYMKQAPPPSYQVAMSNYRSDENAAEAGLASTRRSAPATTTASSAAAATADEAVDNNNDIPNNNNTVHVNANTPPMRRNEQIGAGAASAGLDTDIEVIDAGNDVIIITPNDDDNVNVRAPSAINPRAEQQTQPAVQMNNIPGQVAHPNNESLA